MKSKAVEIAFGTPVDDLRLGISIASPESRMVVVRLENVGKATRSVLSHVQVGGERHFDWFQLRLRDGQGGIRELRLQEDRNRSARIQVPLEPGHALEHQIDAAGWALRTLNGGSLPAPGHYSISATYEVPPEPPYWSGQLISGSVAFDVPTPSP